MRYGIVKDGKVIEGSLGNCPKNTSNVSGFEKLSDEDKIKYGYYPVEEDATDILEYQRLIGYTYNINTETNTIIQTNNLENIDLDEYKTNKRYKLKVKYDDKLGEGIKVIYQDIEYHWDCMQNNIQDFKITYDAFLEYPTLENTMVRDYNNKTYTMTRDEFMNVFNLGKVALWKVRQEYWTKIDALNLLDTYEKVLAYNIEL